MQWAARSLSQLVDRRVDLVSPSQVSSTDVWYLGLEDIEGNGVGVAHPRAFKTAANVQSTKVRFTCGDVLYGRLRPYLNKVWLADRNGLCTPEILVLRTHSEITARYLAYYLRSPYFVESVTRFQKGASLPRVTFDDISHLLVPVPHTIEEQNHITDIFDEASSLSLLGRMADGALATLVPSIFLQLFGSLASNPKGWETVLLGEHCRIIRGASPRPKGNPLYFGGSIPWIKISDATRDNSRWIRMTEEGLTGAGAENSVFLDKGTLVLTNSATVGLPKILGLSGCIHDGFLAFLDLHPKLHRDYLYAVFLLSHDYLSGVAFQGTQKNLNTEIMKRFTFPLPPYEEQLRFANALSEIDTLTSNIGRARLEYNLLSKSLFDCFFDSSHIAQASELPKSSAKLNLPLGSDRTIWSKLSPNQREIWAACQACKTQPFSIDNLSKTLSENEGNLYKPQYLLNTMNLLVTLGVVIKEVRSDADLWRRPNPEIDLEIRL